MPPKKGPSESESLTEQGFPAPVEIPDDHPVDTSESLGHPTFTTSPAAPASSEDGAGDEHDPTAAAGDSAAERTGDTDEDGAGEGDAEADAPKPPRRRQSRKIARLSRELEESRKQRAALEARVAKLETSRDSGDSSDAAGGFDEPRPDPADFDTDEAWDDALADWALRRKQARSGDGGDGGDAGTRRSDGGELDPDQAKVAELEAARAALPESWDDFIDATPDFDERVLDESLPVSDAVRDAVLSMGEDGAVALYHLATHRDELEALNKAAHVAELGAGLSRALASAREAAAKGNGQARGGNGAASPDSSESPKLPSVPDNIDPPPNAAGGGARRDPSQMTDAEYMAWREAEFERTGR